MSKRYTPKDLAYKGIIHKYRYDEGRYTLLRRVASRRAIKYEMEKYNIPTDGSATLVDIFKYQQTKAKEKAEIQAKKEEATKQKFAYSRTKKTIKQIHKERLLLDPVTGEPYRSITKVRDRIKTFVPKRHCRKVPLKYIDLLNDTAVLSHKNIFGNTPTKPDLQKSVILEHEPPKAPQTQPQNTLPQTTTQAPPQPTHTTPKSEMPDDYYSYRPV